MKKVAGLVLAVSLGLGVLTVAGPVAAEEEGYGGGATVTVYYNDDNQKITDVDYNNGYGVTINDDTGDTNIWRQDEDGTWWDVGLAGPLDKGLAQDDSWETPAAEDDGE